MYRVLLQNNETQERRWYTVDQDWDDGCLFAWTEGNWSCDCNRACFFIEASDDPKEWNNGWSFPCGDMLYTALYAELPNGEQIKLDGEPDFGIKPLETQKPPV